MPRFPFDNSYARELPGLYATWNPAPAAAPKLLYLNEALTRELGLDLSALDQQGIANLFAGNALPEGAAPLAQAYAGHQFGHFSPQLGDGRALIIGEVIDRLGNRRDIAFKGSGRTPFSRNGDGKAAVGPMLREVLIGEAMHALGIPTTRALAVVATGEPVYREEALPGAVLTRIAASHIRVGTFEYFAARGELEQVKKLTDYTIARHYPHLQNLPHLINEPERILEFFRCVSERQAALIAQWMNVGFIHGVMNTDNMTLSGETIDYGPCAFMEAYHPNTVFSSIDHQGRYAYGNQPLIARWNLARLAETLLPLLSDDETHAITLATDVINAFPERYQFHWLQGLRAKMGLRTMPGLDQSKDEDNLQDMTLAQDWLTLLQDNKVDHTQAWRYLSTAAAGNEAPLQGLFKNADGLQAWLTRWRLRCEKDDAHSTADIGAAKGSRAQAMRNVNPWLIPRNHRVEEALKAATNEGNLVPFEQLLDALQHPYEEDATRVHLAEPAPESVTACYKTFCGT